MGDHGVTVNEIDDVAGFIARTEPVYDKFFEKNKQVPRQLVQRIRKEATK